MRQFSRFQLILIVATVALVAVNVFLGMGYFQAVSKRADLESDIANKEEAIEYMEGRYNIDALTRELAEANRKLAEDAPFPEKIEPIELYDNIISAAKEAGLDSYTYNPSGRTTENFGGRTYKGVKYAITTSGKLIRLIDFINNLEELPYDTLKITGISLTSAGETWSVRFNLVIIIQ